MPQLTNAATHHGLAESSFRCAYQAKVMKTFEAISISALRPTTESCIRRSFPLFDRYLPRGIGSPRHVAGSGLAVRFRRAAAARTPARASADAVWSGPAR